MAAYTVDARPRVRKALRQLDPQVRKDVLAKMRALPLCQDQVRHQGQPLLVELEG